MADDSSGHVRHALDDAPCGYVTAQPNGTILDANRTFLVWCGATREALQGTKFQRLLTPAGQIYFDTHVGPLLEMQGAVREIALDIARHGAEPLPVLLNAIMSRGEAGSLKLLLFDATDRRRYEQELLRARKLAEAATQTERIARAEAERANRAKDDILALVSHELRTPLSAILGWAQVLRKKAEASPDVQRGLDVIERNTKLLGRLVDDLLDMSRIVSGKLRLDVQKVDLASSIEAALETAQPAAIARQVRLMRILDPAIIVAGDAGRLQQVFWNLLSNAVKFTPAGGAVTVSMERVDSHVEVSVRDTGQGMSDEVLGHVFERFRQSQSESTRQTAGLGLGLSLVRHLVEMHGGAVEAHSAGDGLGSTFLVRLPLAAVEQRAAPEVTGITAISGSEARALVSLVGTRIVVVEDDRDARELLWKVLTDSGAEVVAVEDATSALAAIERHRPDVLVSDIGLPGQDGYELIRSVRMLGGDAGRIPAIALTGHSRLEDRTEALMAGYQFHLAKPVDANELVVAAASLAGKIMSRS